MTPSQFLGFLRGSEVPPERQQRLWLSDEHRKTGLHVIGAPNTGKSKFLEHLIRQDILAGNGLCLIDPHGELYENLLEWCAYFRPAREIIPLNLSRNDYVIGFNPFLRGAGDVAAQVDRRIEATVKAWGAADTNQTPRLEHWLRSLFYALIEADDLTLCEAIFFITFKLAPVRQYLTSRIENDTIRGNWLDLAMVKNYDDFNAQIESTRNRLMRFLSSAVARRSFAIADRERNLNISDAMDRGAIILVNLKWSDDITRTNVRLFGSLLVNEIIEAGLRRSVGAGRRPRPFYLYLDEFQNFVTRDIGEAVTQVRKFGLRFVLAHQLLKQLRDPDADVLEEVMTAVRARAVFGGLNHKDALDLVGDVFPGQIDYTEVKFLRETMKFWPVYDRERVVTTASASSSVDSDMRSSGSSVPLAGLYGVGGEGMSFDSGGWGTTNIESKSNAVADVPIYRPVAYLDLQPEHHSLEEQRQKLADMLILQLTRHCFIRPPSARACPLLVPFVERHPLPEKRIRDYETEMALRAGAMSPSDVDQLILERRHRIEGLAREFAASGSEDVYSGNHESITRRPPKRTKPDPSLDPTAGKAPAPKGKGRP